MQLTRRFQQRVPPCGCFICLAQTSFIRRFPAVKRQVLLGFVVALFGFLLTIRISPPLFSDREHDVRRAGALFEPCQVTLAPR